MESLREDGRIPMCWKCCHMVTDDLGQGETTPRHGVASTATIMGSFTISGCTADPRIQDYEDAQNGCPLWLPIVKELFEKIKEARERR